MKPLICARMLSCGKCGETKKSSSSQPPSGTRHQLQARKVVYTLFIYVFIYLFIYDVLHRPQLT